MATKGSKIIGPSLCASCVVADREIKLGRRALRERSGQVASYSLAVGHCLIIAKAAAEV